MFHSDSCVTDRDPLITMVRVPSAGDAHKATYPSAETSDGKYVPPPSKNTRTVRPKLSVFVLQNTRSCTFWTRILSEYMYLYSRITYCQHWLKHAFQAPDLSQVAFALRFLPCSWRPQPSRMWHMPQWWQTSDTHVGEYNRCGHEYAATVVRVPQKNNKEGTRGDGCVAMQVCGCGPSNFC